MSALVPAALLLSTSALAGCTEPKTLPVSMTGSFVRTESAFFGPKTANLEITPTGIVGRSSGMGMEMTGNPLSGARVSHSDTLATSVLFKAVSCTATSCRFVGQDCEGTITRDGAGDVTIVASASCSSLAGKWLGPQSASKTPSLP